MMKVLKYKNDVIKITDAENKNGLEISEREWNDILNAFPPYVGSLLSSTDNIPESEYNLTVYSHYNKGDVQIQFSLDNIDDCNYLNVIIYKDNGNYIDTIVNCLESILYGEYNQKTLVEEDDKRSEVEQFLNLCIKDLVYRGYNKIKNSIKFEKFVLEEIFGSKIKVKHEEIDSEEEFESIDKFYKKIKEIDERSTSDMLIKLDKDLNVKVINRITELHVSSDIRIENFIITDMDDDYEIKEPIKSILPEDAPKYLPKLLFNTMMDNHQ